MSFRDFFDFLKVFFGSTVSVVSYLSDLLTIVASAIVIYVFFTKRKEIREAFNLLLNWSYQTTLWDLKGKLDRLNEYNANDLVDIIEVKNILHEIAGQIRGNYRLREAAPDLADRLENLSGSRKLSEPLKRSMVAEVRELLKNMEVDSLESMRGN